MTTPSLPVPNSIEGFRAFSTDILRNVCRAIRNDKYRKGFRFRIQDDAAITGTVIASASAVQCATWIHDAVVSQAMPEAEVGQLLHWAVQKAANPNPTPRKAWSGKRKANPLQAQAQIPGYPNLEAELLAAKAALAAAQAQVAPAAAPVPQPAIRPSLVAGGPVVFDISYQTPKEQALQAAPATPPPSKSGNPNGEEFPAQ